MLLKLPRITKKEKRFHFSFEISEDFEKGCWIGTLLFVSLFWIAYVLYWDIFIRDKPLIVNICINICILFLILIFIVILRGYKGKVK